MALLNDPYSRIRGAGIRENPRSKAPRRRWIVGQWHEERIGWGDVAVLVWVPGIDNMHPRQRFD